jgi:hypothetical protein
MHTDATVKGNFDKLVSTIKASKEDLITHGGYDEIVIEDFYDSFLAALQKLEELPKNYEEWLKVEPKEGEDKADSSFPDFVHRHLFSLLCNHDEANYIIMYARFMAGAYLKKNAIMFEDFLGGDVAAFC